VHPRLVRSPGAEARPTCAAPSVYRDRRSYALCGGINHALVQAPSERYNDLFHAIDPAVIFSTTYKTLSGGKAAEVFESREAAFDTIALFVKGFIVLALLFPVLFGWHDGIGVHDVDVLDDGIGVVALVGQNDVAKCQGRQIWYGLIEIEEIPSLISILPLHWISPSAGGPCLYL
jgi:hypothetical protein